MTCPITRLMLGGLLVCTNPWLARAASAADDRAPAEASAAPRAVTPVRLLVFASAPGFAARVRGQLSGLDVTLELETAMPPGPSTERTDALLELAARHTADVIAWLDEAADDASAGPRGCVVHVWIAGRPSLHSRRIGPTRSARLPPHRGADDHHAGTLDTASAIDLGDDDERSASLETAALVVRGAVRAVSFERSGARASTNDLPPEIELRNASPPLAVATPKPASASQSPPLEDTGLSDLAGTPSAARALAWAPHAGLQWSFAGLSPTGRWSLDAGVAVRTGRLSAGVAGSWTFPEVVQYQSVELRLGRQTLLAEVGWNILQTERFALRPSLRRGRGLVLAELQHRCHRSQRDARTAIHLCTRRGTARGRLRAHPGVAPQPEHRRRLAESRTPVRHCRSCERTHARAGTLALSAERGDRTRRGLLIHHAEAGEH